MAPRASGDRGVHLRAAYTEGNRSTGIAGIGPTRNRRRRRPSSSTSSSVSNAASAYHRCGCATSSARETSQSLPSTPRPVRKPSRCSRNGAGTRSPARFPGSEDGRGPNSTDHEKHKQCQGPARHAHRDRTSGAGEIKCLSHGDKGRGQPPDGEQQRDPERVNSGEGPNHLRQPGRLGKPKGAEQLPHVCSGLRSREQLRADEVDQNCPDDPAAHGD